MAARVAARSSISSRASSVRKRGNDMGSLLTEGTFGSLEESARSIATRLMGSQDGNLLGDVAGGTAAVAAAGPTMRSRGRVGGGTNSLSNSTTISMNMRGENSTCSSFGNELSLPSSFARSASRGGGGGGATTAGVHSNDDSLQNHQMRSRDSPQAGSLNNNGGAMQVYDSNQQVARKDESTATASESESVSSKDWLALRISKETKPMMHLLRLLREIDSRDGNAGGVGGDPRSRAVASLMSNFEQKVSLIEHRIKDEDLIMNGEQPPLPKNWICLEDPDSGNVYYANEATSELFSCSRSVNLRWA